MIIEDRIYPWILNLQSICFKQYTAPAWFSGPWIKKFQITHEIIIFTTFNNSYYCWKWKPSPFLLTYLAQHNHACCSQNCHNVLVITLYQKQKLENIWKRVAQSNFIYNSPSNSLQINVLFQSYFQRNDRSRRHSVRGFLGVNGLNLV